MSTEVLIEEINVVLRAKSGFKRRGKLLLLEVFGIFWTISKQRQDTKSMMDLWRNLLQVGGKFD